MVASREAKIYNEKAEELPFSLVELTQGIPVNSDPYVQRGTYYLTGCQSSTNQNNGFRACRHDVRQSTIDFRIPAVLTNKMWSARVFLDKEVVIAPTHYYLPSSSTECLTIGYVADISSFYAKLSRRWLYTGDLAAALKEFYDAKYTFILGKHISNKEEALQRWRQHELNLKQRLRYSDVLITDTNLTFNKVLQTISEQP